MSKKNADKFYYFGKGLPKTKGLRAPIRGEPNSNIDFRNVETGTLHRRRKIGSNGIASKDYDMSDAHKDYCHVHDYQGTLRSKTDRPPTKKERSEIKKAERKKRKWT